MLASVAASKHSCAHVTVDQEVSVKTFAEELHVLTDTTHALGSETGAVEGHAYSLLQVCPFTGVRTTVTLMRRLTQKELPSRISGPSDQFADVKELITDLITDNKLLSEASSEVNHESCRDDELTNAGGEKVDLETQVATHFSNVSRSGEVAESHADLSALSARRLKMDAKIFATTKKDLDLDLDDNPIIENTQISYLVYANTGVLDGEFQQHTVEQIVDFPLSLETAQEHISECIVERSWMCPCRR